MVKDISVKEILNVYDTFGDIIISWHDKTIYRGKNINIPSDIEDKVVLDIRFSNGNLVIKVS